jgi:penicillin-binding protein 2
MFDFLYSKEIKKRKKSRIDKKEIQPEEILPDRVNLKNEFNERTLEVSLINKSFYFLFFFVFLVIALLFFRSFQLQVIENDKYSTMAEKNRFKYMSVDALRGVIYDKNMNQLVFNDSEFSLIFNKKEGIVDGWEENIKEMLEVIDLEYEKTINKIEESKDRFVVILDSVEKEDLIFLQLKIKDFNGFEISKKSFRNYINPNVFSHIIGYTGKISQDEIDLSNNEYSADDYIGKSGVERSYEEDLKIVPGKIKIEKDAEGNVKSEEIFSVAQSGNDLVLWIDSDLQLKIYEEIEKIVNDVGSKNAVAIAMDPRNGAVLSMISYPGFNNNLFSGNKNNESLISLFNDPAMPMFNRVVSGNYPAGSIIKPLIGVAALEEGVISSEKQIYSSGKITIPNPWDPLSLSIFTDLASPGWFTMKKAIALSSNVYFYMIGGGYEDQKGLGVEKIKEYLSFFGWGSKTKIDLPNEKTGLIPDPEWKMENIKTKWTIGDSYNLSIGQGYILTTPIQVVTSFSAIANGGNLFKPMIVWKSLDSNGKEVMVNSPEILNSNFIDINNIEIIRQGMKEAVTYGSAKTLSNLSVDVAAKTGTAQIPKLGHYHNWVTVFAPYDNPEIVLTIMIEEVKGVRAATLPVAKEVLEWYFNNR